MEKKKKTKNTPLILEPLWWLFYRVCDIYGLSLEIIVVFGTSKFIFDNENDKLSSQGVYYRRIIWLSLLFHQIENYSKAGTAQAIFKNRKMLKETFKKKKFITVEISIVQLQNDEWIFVRNWFVLSMLHTTRPLFYFRFSIENRHSRRTIIVPDT